MPEKLERWVTETVGIKRKILLQLEHDDDWTFVIKMHGILEAALNHLLLVQFDNPVLAKVVSKLSTSSEQNGKLAFVKALELLPRDCCVFVKSFSEVRNFAVHDIRNIDLDLVKYGESLKGDQRRLWRIGLISWMSWRSLEAPSDKMRNLAMRVPRQAIYNCCMMILLRCYEKQADATAQKEKILAAFAGVPMFEGFGKPPESTPNQ